MPRIAQAVAFFALLGAGYAVLAPFESGGERLAFLLTGVIVVATITHVLPWAFQLDTEPVRAADER